MLKKLPFRDIVGPPLADPRQRQLEVDGLLGRPVAFGIRDIRAVEPVVATLPMICVECRDTRVRWKGMPPGEIMRRIRPRPGAKCPTFYSCSEHIDSLSLEDAMDERTLLPCKSIKWGTRISSVDSEEPGYRETRGYSPGLACRTKRERSTTFRGSDGP